MFEDKISGGVKIGVDVQNALLYRDIAAQCRAVGVDFYLGARAVGEQPGPAVRDGDINNEGSKSGGSSLLCE